MAREGEQWENHGFTSLGLFKAPARDGKLPIWRKDVGTWKGRKGTRLSLRIERIHEGPEGGGLEGKVPAAPRRLTTDIFGSFWSIPRSQDLPYPSVPAVPAFLFHSSFVIHPLESQ